MLKTYNKFDIFLFNIYIKYICICYEYDFKMYINNKLIELLYLLYKFTETQLKLFCDLVIVDYPMLYLRYLSVYNIISTIYNTRFFIKLFVNLELSVPSITNLYICASWFEREAWDLFGIFFFNNLDLRRILTDYGFYGHPFKKDFPLSGFSEVSYNILYDLVVYDSLKLTQEFRFYNAISPWKIYA